MRYWLVAVFSFLSAASYGQPSSIDSIRNSLIATSSEVTRADLLEELCFQYFASSQYDSIAQYQKQLDKMVSSLKSPRLTALSEFYLAQTFYFLQLLQSLQAARGLQFLDLAASLKSKLLVAKTHREILLCLGLRPGQ